MPNRYLLVLIFLIFHQLYGQKTDVLIRLQEMSASAPLLGHNDTYLYGENWTFGNGSSDVYGVCKRMPALFSTDLDGIETGRTNYAGSVTYDDMRASIIAHYKRGGYVTISWHARHPLNNKTYLDTSDSLIVRKILEQKDTKAIFLQNLDCIANFLLTLRDESGALIPILFRPWHECNGNWFWWGTKCASDEEYKRLWILTHDYLQSRGCSNLIYVFSPGSDFKNEDDYLSRFPGKQYVDVLGVEAYQRYSGNLEETRKEFISRVQKNLGILQSISLGLGMPYAITESGIKANTDKQWWSKALIPAMQGYHPLFVTFWSNQWPFEGRNTFCTYPKEKSAKDFKKIVKKNKLVTIK